MEMRLKTLAMAS